MVDETASQHLPDNRPSPSLFTKATSSVLTRRAGLYTLYTIYTTLEVKTAMGRRYLEPTVYRDRCCPHCGYYFTARGLNGHIRFYHEGYEKHEITRLKKQLFNKAINLLEKGYGEVEYFIHRLGTYSDATLDELHEIAGILDTYQLRFSG